MVSGVDGPPRGYGVAMANEHGPLSPRVRLTAGTAFKAGFFGALGVVVAYVVLSLVVGVVLLVLGATVLPSVGELFRTVLGS